MFLARPAARRHVARLAFASSILALVTACGGGGGDSTPPPPPPPTPVIALTPTTVAVGGQAGQAPTSTTTQVTVANGASGALGNLAVGTVTYSTGASNWLTATLASATAPTQLNLAANWAGIAAGTYTATVPVTSTTTGVAAQNVTVTLTVSAPPAIRLVPDNVTLTAIVDSTAPATQNVQVQNAGGGTLGGLAVGTVTYAGGPNAVTGWLTPRFGATTAPATLAFDASTAGLIPGVYLATVPVTSTATGVSNSPQTVNVALQVNAKPRGIAFQPAGAVTFTAAVGGTPSGDQTVRLVNNNRFDPAPLTGVAVGAIAYTGPAGWLAVRRAPVGTAPDSVVLGIASVAGLAAGEYSATVPVSATGVPTRNIAVRLVIGGTATPPRIDIAIPGNPGDGAVALAMNQGAALPAPVPVQITNGGQQPLTGLSFVIVETLQATWLAPQLSASGSGATLTVQVNNDARALARGTYRATIRVRSDAPGVTNSPIDIPVRLEVR